MGESRFNQIFSIGIPTRNRAALLRQSIKSALAQTYPNVEVIVCDNASTDETRIMVEAINDARLRYIRNDKDIGALKNFEKVLRHCTGDYFAWLQDDDWLCSDFAESMVGCLEQSSASCCFAPMYESRDQSSMAFSRVFASHVPLDWSRAYPQQVELDYLLPLSLFETVGMPPCAAYRRSELLKVVHVLTESRFPLYAERSLAVTMAREGGVIVFPRCLGMYRWHEGQLSKQLLSNSEDAHGQYLLLIAFLEKMWEEEGRTAARFAELIGSIDRSVLAWWRKNLPPEVLKGKLCSAVASALDARAAPTGGRRAVWDLAHRLCPPMLWDFLRERLSSLSGRG